MATLSPQDIRILEHTRQRLAQLTNSLASLQQQIHTIEPLPPWSSLHSLSQIISQNLASVSAHLTTHGPLLSSLVAYPLPLYPGREQEPVLNQLLRKKFEPHVEDWVEEGRLAGEEVVKKDGGRGTDEITDLWEWAGIAANEQARKHEWGGDYTADEIEGGIENVVTGLRDDESDEEEGEKEDQEGAWLAEWEGQENKKPEEGGGKSLSMDDMLRFLVRGEEPKE
ncbi:MAG: mediator of RNA polymerase II transcription subunit 8 [Alectoria fallacina]|uniref:Mediator of RNA polymerase II transcription subunit 8 n=1 Tax=Alectoria fallacina TaxID=1903189 RepID=A0A8H3EK90_9LECA|nr:MAG: mediator of RNA polymerase II transcription subunit 8 [Alectoria fallacina]